MRYLARATCCVCLVWATSTAQTVLPSDVANVFAGHAFSGLNGSGTDVVTAIAAGNNGAIYVGGNTTSLDFPLKNVAQPETPEAVALIV